MTTKSMGSRLPKRAATPPCFLPGPASLPVLFAIFTAVSAVIDPLDLAALTQVVQDLNVPKGTRWAPGSDPCTTWATHATCDETQTRVTKLALNSLGLTGVVSPALGNLTQLTVINFSNNLLHGYIPESIGLLTNLTFLVLGLNNLTGPIPDSIGYMTALTSLFLDNNFLSGSIPASIGNLTKLTELHLYCNHLEGAIPPELGALAQLQDFQLHSNKLAGQIPATFAKLTKVTAVRLNNNQLSGPLDLPLLQSWGSSLTLLHLHRNSFSGSIPALDQTTFPVLKNLNLGFNNLTGQLPESFGFMASLSSLFVGHNFLEGPVPGSFTHLEDLQFLDLSHNALNGSLLNLTGIGLLQTPQFDLTFNNFNAVDIPSVLVQENNTLYNCLDSVAAPPPFAALAPSPHLGGFPAESAAVSRPLPSPPPAYSVLQCVRYLPGGTTEFAVNAGSVQEVSNTNHQVFTPDNLLDKITTGTEVESSGQWAVQMSGEQGGTYSNPVRVSQTADNQALYQSMRWSSQYLAYIARNMRIGIFRVKLHFAEIAFNYPGYRVFDVVVQGKMINASLDVVAVAGPKAAYVIDLQDVAVEDGLLRIELIHVSPINRYIDPIFGVQDTGPMLSAFSVQPVSLDLIPPPTIVPGGPDIPNPQNSPGKGSKKSTPSIVLSVLGSLVVALGCTLIAYFCFFKGRKDSESLPGTAAGRVHNEMRTAGRSSSITQVSAGTTKVQDLKLSIPGEGWPVETSRKTLPLATEVVASELLASLREALAQQQQQLDGLRQENALQAAQITSLERAICRSSSRGLSRSPAVDSEIRLEPN